MEDTPYDRIGRGYADRRRPDPRMAAQIARALEGMRSVVNVGAGTGSYEPAGIPLVAIEPSVEMIAQRPPDAVPAVIASAERLPLAGDSVDAAMSVLSLHHWDDWRAGLAEMLRVARRRVVLLTWDPDGPGFWLTRDYLPELHAWDRTRFPGMDELLAALPAARVEPVPIPRDCEDGFLAAFWARPERYLDPEVRTGMSIFAQAPDPAGVRVSLQRLAGDLASGEWERRYGTDAGAIDAGYRLVVAEP